MVGGEIVEIVQDSDEQLIKVRDNNDIAWRRISGSAPVAVGDKIWWQSFKAYITSPDRIYDEDMIGYCRPSEGPDYYGPGSSNIL